MPGFEKPIAAEKPAEATPGPGLHTFFGISKPEKTIASERPADATPIAESRGPFGMAQPEIPAVTVKATHAARAPIPRPIGPPNPDIPRNTQPFGSSPSSANPTFSFGNSQPFSSFGKVAENEKKTTSLFGQRLAS